MTSDSKSSEESRPFHKVRERNGMEAAEDYTEIVLDLIEECGEARTGAIAERYGVSHVTALRTIRRLQGEGLVETARHKPVTLTARGRQLAIESRERHKIVRDFLLHIGVPPNVAEVDSEGIEHHVSKTTLDAMVKAMSNKA